MPYIITYVAMHQFVTNVPLYDKVPCLHVHGDDTLHMLLGFTQQMLELYSESAFYIVSTSPLDFPKVVSLIIPFHHINS